MSFDALKQLEERVQESINRIQQLQGENEALVRKLAESERRFEEANSQLKQMDGERRELESERTEVRGRIEKMLERFNGLDLG
jgi:predicted nuclease with TOPRIM domain